MRGKAENYYYHRSAIRFSQWEKTVLSRAADVSELSMTQKQLQVLGDWPRPITIMEKWKAEVLGKRSVENLLGGPWKSTVMFVFRNLK